MRLKVLPLALIPSVSMLFQFLLVRLKEKDGLEKEKQLLFQFLLVRLKALLSVITDKTPCISIPFGAIKSLFGR